MLLNHWLYPLRCRFLVITGQDKIRAVCLLSHCANKPPISSTPTQHKCIVDIFSYRYKYLLPCVFHINVYIVQNYATCVAMFCDTVYNAICNYLYYLITWRKTILITAQPTNLHNRLINTKYMQLCPIQSAVNRGEIYFLLTKPNAKICDRSVSDGGMQWPDKVWSDLRRLMQCAMFYLSMSHGRYSKLCNSTVFEVCIYSSYRCRLPYIVLCIMNGIIFDTLQLCNSFVFITIFVL